MSQTHNLTNTKSELALILIHFIVTACFSSEMVNLRASLKRHN